MSDEIHPSLSHLGFNRVEPSADLIHVIDCYWFIKTDLKNPIKSVDYLHPDGGMGIILNYCDAMKFEGEVNKDSCIFDGTTTHSRLLGLDGVFDSVGIRFKPAGAFLFLPMSLNEIKNETISLEDIQLKRHQKLYYQISKASTIKAKVLVIEKWLRQSLLERTTSPIVTESIHYINTHRETLSISLLAKTLGYGQRRIERLFSAQVGMTAKEYDSNLRIEDARNRIKHNKDNNSLTEIAYELGYYDQAHFTKKFKNCIGITPSAYSKRTSKTP